MFVLSFCFECFVQLIVSIRGWLSREIFAKPMTANIRTQMIGPSSVRDHCIGAKQRMSCFASHKLRRRELFDACLVPKLILSSRTFTLMIASPPRLLRPLFFRA